MSGSTRIRGTKLALTLGSPGEDFWADISKYELNNQDADSDIVTFKDANEGGAVEYRLTGSAIQSTDKESFWSYVWDNTGEEVPFTLAPHGNTTPSEAQPHFVGTVKIGRKPALGGEAGQGSFAFDFDWQVIGEPIRDLGD